MCAEEQQHQIKHELTCIIPKTRETWEDPEIDAKTSYKGFERQKGRAPVRFF
jgi:hypothetical protein